MRPRLAAFAVLVVLASVCPTCRPLPGSAPTVRPPTAELAWPRPPEPARIRYVQTVAHPRDLGIRPSFWKRVGRVFTGERHEWFVRPTGVAVRGSIIYVADPGAQALWILDAEAGRWHTIQKAGEHPLISPVAVAAGRDGRVYLADSYLAKVFVYDAGGRLTGTIGSPHLGRPAGVAYDERRDLLYVADSVVHGVWTFDYDGKPLGMIGQRGVAEGEFNFPTHVAVDEGGAVYVTDALNFRLQLFGADGTFERQFGRHGNLSGDFASPKGVGVDRDGHIYVVDALFDAVQIFDRQGHHLLTFGERGIGPGQFWLPGGLFIDSDNRIYVADGYNQRIQIFEYLAGGDDG